MASEDARCLVAPERSSNGSAVPPLGARQEVPRELSALVRAEQVRILFRQIPAAFAVHTALGALLVGMVRGHVSSRALLVWYAAVVAALALRMGFWVRYRRERPGPTRATVWIRRYVFAACCAGVAWGSGALVLLPPDSELLQVAVTAIVVCLAAGITAITLASATAHYAFGLLGVAPYAVAFALQGSPLSESIAGAIVVFLVGNGYLARNNARLFAELITLRLDVAAQRDAAQQANQAKSRFLAAASHDLRQPLHSMTLLASALDGRMHDADDRRIVARLQGSLAAMGKLFNALLDISRLEAGIVEPRIMDVRVSRLLERLQADHARQAQEKHLEWRCPPTALVVRSDPVLLETLLRNLVVNAIRYTSHGHVAVACREVDGLARIEVQDTGIGIPPDRQAEIFREFHQLDNPERDGDKGLGLGLAIVDRLARLLDHRVEVHSTPGQGSCFAVVLPLGSPGRAAEEKGADGAELPPDSGLTGMVVLVIDDQPAVLESMEALLSRWGCETILAASEGEAIVALRKAPRPPELIVADYRLRNDRTGSQAAERIRRELGRPIPALIVTGDTAPERLREAKASGDMLMSKPVAPERMREFLRSVRRVRPR